MLAEELKEQLKQMSSDVETIKAYWHKSPVEARYQQLHDLSGQENFWQNPDQTTILKELQHLKNEREAYHAITHSYQELHDLIDLFKDDEAELKRLAPEINALKKKVVQFKIQVLLRGPEDSANCFFSINAGAGGTESQDWADMLLRMYIRFCEREQFSYAMIDYQPGEGAGIKSATLFVKGTNAYGLLKAEEGIHRLVRISPFDANKRRHTSFAAVSATPEIAQATIEIDPKDLRIDTYRSGGAGGQHVNKTESAVRITHIPTNTVVQCQNDRSQIANRETAMKMLYAKLAQKQRLEHAAKLAKMDKKNIEWGSQIRSYVLHPYKMVKDHRTDYESPQPELVLDGDLMPFIEAYLVATAG
ncbi:MAG: peptide chain release factor 2 [Candidatus Babeliales bacterium]